MKPRNRPHLSLPTAVAETYSKKPPNIWKARVDRDRDTHGGALQDQLREAEKELEERRKALTLDQVEEHPGTLLVFSGPPRRLGARKQAALEADGFDLASLGVEVRNVREVKVDDDLVQDELTMFVPDGALPKFLSDLDAYREASSKTPKFDYVEAIRLATVRALWTDASERFPETEDEVVAWEVWLARAEGCVERFGKFAAQVGAEVNRRALHFRDRIVLFVEASARQLAHSVDMLSAMAELRRPPTARAFFSELSPVEQHAPKRGRMVAPFPSPRMEYTVAAVQARTQSDFSEPLRSQLVASVCFTSASSTACFASS